MKAPDKIYIQTDMINNIPLEQQEFDDDVVYIRKETLLNWVRENEECIIREMLAYRVAPEEQMGKLDAYRCVILKLQEL